MTDGSSPAERGDAVPRRRAGERLRAAREAQGLTLAEIAARTRVPIRHLEAIESGEYRGTAVDHLCGRLRQGLCPRGRRSTKWRSRATCAAELATISAARAPNIEPYELDRSGARAAARPRADRRRDRASLVLIGASAVVRHRAGSAASERRRPRRDRRAADAGAARPSPPRRRRAGDRRAGDADRAPTTSGCASMTRAGKTLFENTMKPGDAIDVPADADHPMINVGRPDKLQVTLNGAALPPLGTARGRSRTCRSAPPRSRARATAPRRPPATRDADAGRVADRAAPTPTAAPTPPPAPTPRATRRRDRRPASAAGARHAAQPRAAAADRRLTDVTRRLRLATA